MPYNLIFIDESESMQRAVATIFLDNPEFKLSLANEPSFLYKTAKNFLPDIIVLSYNTIDTELKKSIAEIKTSKEFSNTPLVLLVPSDLSDNERETLLKLKADGFIYRPFDKDAFISKIKRILSENYTPVHILENAGNSEEKIYDISTFETKKIPPPSPSHAPAAPSEDPNLADLSASSYSAESADGSKEQDAIIDLESSELSQAFENLFKDDAIFKEFQDLNKKEESAGPSEPAEPEEPAEPSEPAEPEEPAEPKSLGDILEMNKYTLPDESPASNFGEPFAGFNIALDNNQSGFSELKTGADINTKKSEGELNLKILDEQNLVKLDDFLKNALEKTFEEIKPQIIETIKNNLPEIIEKLVKEEIEKIKQQ
ncbi:MAG: hypothetical protein ACYDDB_02610 [bacterium]